LHIVLESYIFAILILKQITIRIFPLWRH